MLLSVVLLDDKMFADDFEIHIRYRWNRIYGRQLLEDLGSKISMTNEYGR